LDVEAHLFEATGHFNGALLCLRTGGFGFVFRIFDRIGDALFDCVNVADAVFKVCTVRRRVFLHLFLHQICFRLQHFGIRSHLCLHLFAALADVTNTVLQFFTGGFGVGFELSDIRFQVCGGFGHQIAVIRFVVAEFQLRAWRRQRGDARRWIGLRQAAEALRRGSRAFLQVRGRLREVVVRLCFRFLEAVFDIRCAHLNIRAGLCGGVFDVLRGLRGIVLRFLRARFDVAGALLHRFDRVFRRFFCFSFPQLRLDFRQRRIRLHLIDGFIPARFHVFCTLLHVLCRLFCFLLRFRHGALQIFNRVLGGVFDRIRRIFRRI